MDAFNNAKNRIIEKEKTRIKLIDSLTGIDRMLVKIDQWEEEFEISTMKQDTESFRIALNANRNRIFSQLKKL